jgi:predicted transcriptional regulator
VILQVYVDDDTAHRLGLIASETGRPSEELAECSVAEAALDYFRRRRGDIPKATDETKEKGK